MSKHNVGSPGLREFWSGRYSAGGGPVTRLVSQRIGAILAWLSLRASRGPAALTLLGASLAALASALFAILPAGGAPAGLCLVLYQLAYGADCADGQLARATHTSSEFGAWLDISCDCVSVLLLSFAVAYLTLGQGVAAAWVLPAVALFSIGRVLSLYSSKAVGASGAARENRPINLATTAKTLLWFFIDTPVLLLCVCLFRDHAQLLLGFAVFIGGAQSLQALWLGWRLRTGPGE